MVRSLTCLLLALGSLLVGSTDGASNPTECLGAGEALDPNTDYFPNKVQVEASEYWSIEYSNTYKVVRNLESMSTFVLYPCGSDPPAAANFPDTNVTAFVPIPLKSVGVMMTPTITYLEQINMLDTVDYFLTEPEYISSPCFLARVQAGFVAVPIGPEQIVDPTTGVSTPSGPPNVTLNGTVAFGYSYDTPTFFQTIVPISESMEVTNQGIFEWVKYIAAFYNREELANGVFDETQAQWDCVSREASATATDSAKPKVLWAYYSEYCGGWDVGDPCPNYYCEFATACGADLVDPTAVNGTSYNDLCGVTYLTTSELVELGKDADIWFFPAPNWDATYANFTDQLNEMKSVQSQQVYDYQGSGKNAWFQERFAEYYDVLADFCRAVGTHKGLSAGERWFRNVFTDPVGDQGECNPDQAPTLPFVFGGCDDNAGSGGNNNSNSTTGGGNGTTGASSAESRTTRQAMLGAAALLVLACL
jgi:iron complex transport system substrate-binding protein